MAKYLLLFTLILLMGCKEKADFNNGFEELNDDKTFPAGWSFQAASIRNFKLETGTKHEGRYSLSIQNSISYSTPQEIENSFSINEDEKSGQDSSIELTGFMKVENIEGGYAGVWLKLEGANEQVVFADQKQSGTQDWAEYTVRLPYSKKIRKIAYGGILAGVGKVWLDDFKIYVDGKPASKLIQIPIKNAQLDTAFRTSSRIKEIPINTNVITNLSIVGQFWGFMKYHHPYVTGGNMNWDAQLFKLVTKALHCRDVNELSSNLEVYLDSMPVAKKCEGCKTTISSKVLINPDYGDLLSGKILTKSLTSKLRNVQQNRSSKQSCWVRKDSNIDFPQFTNEKSYEEMAFPDAGYRLLSLFRYWSIINYYYPYKKIAQPDWNQVLKDFIPQFIVVKNAEEYTLTTLKLIAMLNDTHANIWGNNPIIEAYKGKYRTPFYADFIENKLVITGFRTDTLQIREKVKLGDIIVSINGEITQKLIKKYLPITPASNYQTQLRDLPSSFLLKCKDNKMRFVISRNGKISSITVPLISRKSTYKDPDQPEKKGYYLINNEIGYVDAGQYMNSDLSAIKKLFLKTKGLIVDLRTYPSDFMPYTFGNYLKPKKSLFVRFSVADYSLPGSFIMADSAYNGSEMVFGAYNGKVVAIVNSNTQSQGEFTAMAFQSSANVKVIGSQTAGADGNVTGIVLPGGIHTMISGMGIFYPDHSQTQRIGVRIDKIVKPTIKGIINKKDELLEKAVNILNSGQ